MPHMLASHACMLVSEERDDYYISGRFILLGRSVSLLVGD